MADSDVKAMTANLDAVEFEETAFTIPVPLAEAKVAIVTSASLHHPEDEDFSPGWFKARKSSSVDNFMRTSSHGDDSQVAYVLQ